MSLVEDAESVLERCHTPRVLDPDRDWRQGSNWNPEVLQTERLDGIFVAHPFRHMLNGPLGEIAGIQSRSRSKPHACRL